MLVWEGIKSFGVLLFLGALTSCLGPSWEPLDPELPNQYTSAWDTVCWGTSAPRVWCFAEGQMLEISHRQSWTALFTLVCWANIIIFCVCLDARKVRSTMGLGITMWLSLYSRPSFLISTSLLSLCVLLSVFNSS